MPGISRPDLLGRGVGVRFPGEPANVAAVPRQS